MHVEIFEDVYDLLYRLKDHDKELVNDAIGVCREFGGPCVISPNGIMIHTKSYLGNNFYGFVTDMTNENMEYAAREISDAMRDAVKSAALVKKTA